MTGDKMPGPMIIVESTPTGAGNVYDMLREKVVDAYRLTPEQLGIKPPKRELEKVIDRLAWKMALADGRGSDEPDIVIATRLGFGRARYQRMARAAYDELMAIDAARENKS